MKLKAILTVGVSASGKSTFAKELVDTQPNWTEINRDWIRFNVVAPNTDWNSYKFSSKNEKDVTQIQFEMLNQAWIDEQNVIISDTNLNPKVRARMIELLDDFDYEVEIKEFPVSFEEAIRRDRYRLNGVGQEVIYKQWKQWNTYIGRKTYTPDISLPKAVVCDLDGTLFHMVSRGPFEWDKVGEDEIDWHVKQMLCSLKAQGHAIILLSGRDSVCRKLTEDSLKENWIEWDNLYMRDEGSYEKDTIVKERLFFNHIAPNYNVELVIDDRPCIVRLWHELKIPKVWAVGNPYLEF